MPIRTKLGTSSSFPRPPPCVLDFSNADIIIYKVSAETVVVQEIITHLTTMKRKLNENDVPEPASEVSKAASTFAQLGLDARILQAITSEKFAKPTSVQSKAIPLALSGKDILGKLVVVLTVHTVGRLTWLGQLARKPALVKLPPMFSPSCSPSCTVKQLVPPQRPHRR